MLVHYLPELVGAEPYEVHELSAYLDANDAPLSEVNRGRRLAYHDSCHMLRELGISDAPRRLLERSGATARAAREAGSLLRLRRDVLRAPTRGLGGARGREARRRRRRRTRS